MAGEVLSVELQLLDSVTSPARRVTRALGNATEGMFNMSRGAFSLTRGLDLVHDSTGRVATTFDALQSIGVTTTAQIQDQIVALDALIAKTKDDTVATAQLTARQQSLKNQLAGTSTTMRGASTSALDAQQAFTGFGILLRGATTGSLSSVTFGLTQFSNNLNVIKIRAERAGTSIKGILVKALKGGGGLALALTAAGLAFELFSRSAKSAKADIEGVASSLLTIPKLAQIEFDIETARKAIPLLEERIALFKEAGREALVAATNVGLSVPALTKIKSLLAVTSQRQKNIADEFRSQLATLKEQAIVGGILVSLEGKRVINANKEADALERASAAESNRLIKNITRQFGIELEVAMDIIDLTRAQKQLAEFREKAEKQIRKVFSTAMLPDRFGEVLPGFAERLEKIFAVGNLSRVRQALEMGFVTPLEAAQREAAIFQARILELSNLGPGGLLLLERAKEQFEEVSARLNKLLSMTAKQVAAIEVGKNFLDPFAQGLSDVILQLGTVNDLLDGMKQAFADLLALGIKGGIGALVGSLFGPGGAAAGFSLATGIGGRQQVLPPSSPVGVQQQLVAVVRGTDLAFILRETASREGA